MKTFARLLSLGLFIASLFSTFILGYFEYALNRISPEVKPYKSTSSTKASFDFTGLLSKFYVSPEKSSSVSSSISSFPGLPSLKAIFWSGKKSMALLLFEKEALWVKKGDTIKGWKVEDVFPDYVVLSFNNNKVKIKLFKSGEETKEISQSGSSYNIKTNSGIFVISKEKVKELTADIGSLFSKIGLRPYLKKGQIEGMQIIYIAPGSIFEKVGLRKGDIILSINNIPVRTNEDAFRIIETLQSSSFIEVKIKRRRKIVKLKVEVV